MSTLPFEYFILDISPRVMKAWVSEELLMDMDVHNSLICNIFR